MAVLDQADRLHLAEASVLVCDTSQAEQDVLVGMLGGFGISRITRSQRPDLLASEASRPFDLIFVGASALESAAMAGISELRRTVGHPSRTSPIVVVSSYTPRAMIDDARAAGATFVLAKPLTSQIVFDRILWLAVTTRDFIETETYFGPDRRVRVYGPPPGEAGRRHDDLPAVLGDAKESNMSQDEIDNLMKPARVAL